VVLREEGEVIDAVMCEKCGSPMTPCFGSNIKEVMSLKMWWCLNCDHTSAAIGREKAIRLDDWEDRDAQ